MLLPSIGKNSLILSGFALVTAAILAFTFLATADKIAAAERAAAQKALLEIVPAGRHDNDLLSDLWPLPSEDLATLNLGAPASVYIARMHGDPVAVIIPLVAPDGYSGDIKLIVGINADGTIAGVRALSHKETPGLGDKVDLAKSAWVLAFNGKSLEQPELARWKVKKDGGDFDQFTGATITPRAVVNQVKNALLYFQAHQQDMFAAQAPPPPTTTHEAQP